MALHSFGANLDCYPAIGNPILATKPYEELHERILKISRYHQEQNLTWNRMSSWSLNFDELYLRGYWELEVNQGIRVYLRE